jgi:hypothetical protein
VRRQRSCCLRPGSPHACKRSATAQHPDNLGGVAARAASGTAGLIALRPEPPTVALAAVSACSADTERRARMRALDGSSS